MVEVRQEDREAAASLANDIGEHDIASNILAGLRDPYTWVQHFARHREAAVAAERERCAGIAYRTCAETRHVTLGDKCAQAIRTASETTNEG